MTSPSQDNPSLRTWVEIDRAAIAHNYRTFRELLKPATKLAAVVKSNAYGHGLVEFAREVENLGIDCFAVDSVVEALTLRRSGITVPLLVLGMTLPSRFEEAARYDIAITVSNFTQLKKVREFFLATEIPLAIHVKADTGMHRQGFSLDDIPKVIEDLKHDPTSVRVDGLYTHFAAAKDPGAPEVTEAQLKEFHAWIDAFKVAGFAPTVHAAATGATLLFPDTHFDMVRVGIGLYGLWPSPETQVAREDILSLKPVLAWRSVIAEIKNLPKGAKIGYDHTETLMRDSRVAVVPIGYWHGYPRALSSSANTIVRGTLSKVLGRIAMDMIVIDVTDTPEAAIFDQVTLIGIDGKSAVSADALAKIAGTINYEMVTRLNPRMARRYAA